MAMKKPLNPYYICLCLLFFNTIYSFGGEVIKEAANYEIVNSGWELIEKEWPSEDPADAKFGKKTQFYYLKNQKTHSNWPLRPSAFLNITDESIFFKLSFKYWAFISDEYTPSTNVIYNGISIDISDKYIKNYENEWMPCEYILSYQNLSSFEIQNLKYWSDNVKSLIAFKDIRVEYEQQSSNSKILFDTKNQNKDQIQPEIYKIGANQYQNPGQTTDDFLFFSECVDGCSIELTQNYLQQINSKTIKSYQITYEYWLNGKSGIILKSDKSYASPVGRWELVNITNSEKFAIEIKTPIDGESFVAIRNLEITISFADSSSELIAYVERSSPFKLKGSIWSKPFNHLTNGKFFYPKAPNNSLSIMKSDGTKVTEMKVTLEYWTLKDSLIKVMYSSRDENTKNTILTIKPQTQTNEKQLEKTEFFLRDLIAVRNEPFTISVVVEFADNDYTNCLSFFAIKINYDGNDKSWKFEEHKANYLKPTMNEAKWIALTGAEHLTSRNDFFRFEANAKSDIPASAHLLSTTWVKYNESLHLVDPEYRITVDKKEFWTRFTVRPKVCDWLAHCSDVIQELKEEEDQRQTYSFKFNRLRSPNYIKLLFYIEYFKNSSGSEIKFNLELIHFGDPCFLTSQCINNPNPECQIEEKDEKITRPNYYNCGDRGNCNSRYTGERCEIYNSCLYSVDNKQKGKDRCDKVDCIPLANSKDFMCACGKNTDEKIIWDPQKKECITPRVSTKSNWDNINNEIYYPTKSEKSLIYEFQNIDSAKSDVCINMVFDQQEYQENILMNVIYLNEKKRIDLIKINLLKTSNELDFCVRNFVYDLDATFSISIQLIGLNKNNDNGKVFRLKKFSPKINEFNLMRYIDNWSKWKTTEKNPAFKHQTWKTYPKESFEQESDDRKEFYIKFKSGNMNVSDYKATFTSNWIKPDNNFRTKYFYDIKYKDEIFKENCKIIQKTVFKDTESSPIERKWNETSRTPTDDGYILSTFNVIEIPQNLKTPFRISFEIEYSVNDPKESCEFWIKNLVLGDPCYKYGEEKSIECRDDAVCQPLGPERYNCESADDKLKILNSTKDNVCFKNYDDRILVHQYCQKMSALVDDTYTKCIPGHNSSFECGCVEGDFYWDQDSKRCIRMGYSLMEETCQENNCEIFDLSKVNVKYSDKNIPSINSKTRQYLPFYYPTKSSSGFKVRIKDLKPDEDACFKLSHLIGEKSNLGISYGQSNSLFFSPLQTKKPDWKFIDDEFCARSLISDDAKSAEFTISALMNDAFNDIIAFKFNEYDTNHKDIVYLIQNSDIKFTNEIPYLTFSNKDKEFVIENQWVLRMPHISGFWSLNEDNIQFLANKSPIKQKTFIMSNRLRKDLDSNELRFNLDSNSNFKNLVLKIKILDDNLNLAKEDFIIGDRNIDSKVPAKTDNPFKYIVPKMSSNFRIIIEVEYFITDGTSADFKLSKINLGDPCIGEDSSSVCKNSAKCNRLDQGKGFNCTCLDKSYTGKLCDQRDYCNVEYEKNGRNRTGDQHCKDNNAGKCQNTLSSFTCECSEGKFWNEKNYKCEDYPKCFSHVCDYKTQKCNEPDDGKSEAYCTCLDAYVDLSNNSSTLNCQKFDVCNETHRKASKFKEYRSKKACEDPNEVCVSNADKPNGYLCLCPEGFDRDEDNRCQPALCSYSNFNQCQQKCGYDNSSPQKLECSCFDTDIYHAQGNECIKNANKTCDNCKDPAFCVGTKCQCKHGYILTNGECKPDDSVIHLWNCPKPKKNVTNEESICDCGEEFVLDTAKKTCKLKPMCGKEGIKRAECDKINALCSFKNDEFICECPEGKVWSSSQVNKTCIDYCNHYDNNEYCETKNADCNPLGYDPAHDKCICKSGLVWEDKNKNMCVIPQKTILFQLSIKNDLEKFWNSFFYSPPDSPKRLIRDKRQTLTNSLFYSDPNGLKSDIESKDQLNDEINKVIQKGLEQHRVKQSISSLIQKILPTSFSGSVNRLNIETCTLNSNQFYDCKILLSLGKTSRDPLDQSIQNLRQSMNESCIGKGETCFFNMGSSILIVSRNSFESESFKIYKPCEGDRKISNCPYYASCKPYDDSTVFSCLCDQNVFINKTTNYFKVEGTLNDIHVIRQTCEVKNQCDLYCAPNDKQRDCVQSNPYPDDQHNWVAPFHCSCKGNFNLTSDNKACIDVCNDVKCNNHGKCKYRGLNGFACECDEGWSGELCNYEYKAALGGWIAGIVILAVLVVIASGVALIYARRSRNSGHSSNHSSHQMDDYTGTSYRVGQSNTGASRSQPGYQGRDNQAFHRD